jgi:hypothetical protein
MSFFQILKSMAVSHFLKSTSNDDTDVCPTPKGFSRKKYQVGSERHCFFFI